MSKKDINMQRGLHVQQLTSGAAAKSNGSTAASGSSKEVAQYRESCPPGTTDLCIAELIKQMNGDKQKIQNAINEMWEDHRGGEINEWATVKAKKTKKKEHYEPLAHRGGGGGRGRGVHGRENIAGGREQMMTGRGRGRSAPPGGRGESFRGRGTPPQKRVPTRGISVGAQDRPLNTTQQTPTECWAQDTGVADDSQTSATDAWNANESHVPQGAGWTTESSHVQQTSSSSNVSTNSWHKESLSGGSQQTATSSPSSGWGQTTVDSTSSPSSSGWGVTTTESASGSAANSESPRTPNAWARGSPLITSTLSKPQNSPQRNSKVPSTSTESSQAKAETPVQPGIARTSRQTVNTSVDTKTPENAADMRASQASVSASASTNTATIDRLPPTSGSSPKQYLKLGKWDNPASDLSVQFGSFALESQVDSNPTHTSSSWSSNVNVSSAWNSSSSQVVDSKSVDPADKPSPVGKVVSDANFAPSKFSPVHAKSSPRRMPLPRSPATPTDRQTMDPSVGNVPPGLTTVRTPNSPKMLQARDLEVDVASSRNKSDTKASQIREQQSQQQSQHTTTAFQQPETQMAAAYGGYPLGSSTASSATLSSPYQQQFQYGMRTLTQPDDVAVQDPLSSAAVKQARDVATTKNVAPSSVASVTSQAHIATSANARGQSQQPVAHLYQQQQQQYAAPPPPPGMAVSYNPYNYGNYYQQGYGYYQNPQYPAYSPRQQYPPRGNVPYGVDGSMQGFSNPQSLQLGYQDQLAHQYGAVPQGFGDLGGYLQHQPQQLQPHGHRKPMGSQQPPNTTGGPNNQTSGTSVTSAQPAAYPAYSSTTYPPQSSRDHAESPPIPGASSYGSQPYGWGGSYGQPSQTAWAHMMAPQGLPYQQPSQVPGVVQHQQHPHYQRYGAATGESSNGAHAGSGAGSGSHTTWST